MAVAVALCAAAITGCKPTEKNYKAAYDAAIAKRAKDSKPNEDVPEGVELIREGAPRRTLVAGDTLWVRTEPLSGYGADASTPVAHYNIVIASYKMPANAAAQSANFAAEGWKSRVLKNRDELFYVVAAQCSTIEETASQLRTFKKRYPRMHYVGLPDGPFVAETPRR